MIGKCKDCALFSVFDNGKMGCNFYPGSPQTGMEPDEECAMSWLEKDEWVYGFKPKTNYHSWPLGQLAEELQRPELEQIREKYPFNDPREVVDIFEKKVAEFSGAKFGIAVDCCTHAIELSLRYLLHKGELKKKSTITIPNRTYVSVGQLIHGLCLGLNFHQDPWTGVYQLRGSRVYDGAVRWMERMYVGDNALHCLSFQIKKRIPIGRGGMVITNDQEAYEWLKLARYDGRDMSLPYTDPSHVKIQGYHYYMTPEDAARGIILMDQIPGGPDTGNDTTYPNIESWLAKTK